MWNVYVKSFPGFAPSGSAPGPACRRNKAGRGGESRLDRALARSRQRNWRAYVGWRRLKFLEVLEVPIVRKLGKVSAGILLVMLAVMVAVVFREFGPDIKARDGNTGRRTVGYLPLCLPRNQKNCDAFLSVQIKSSKFPCLWSLIAIYGDTCNSLIICSRTTAGYAAFLSSAFHLGLVIEVKT